MKCPRCSRKMVPVYSLTNPREKPKFECWHSDSIVTVVLEKIAI